MGRVNEHGHSVPHHARRDLDVVDPNLVTSSAIREDAGDQSRHRHRIGRDDLRTLIHDATVEAVNLGIGREPIALAGVQCQHHAVGRAADSGAPIGLDEAITVREAIGGAFVMKHESWRGTLLRGMAADLIALDRDPFVQDASSLRQTKVLMTMLRGEVVHNVLQPEWRSATA
jgi:hypothetical protein